MLFEQMAAPRCQFIQAGGQGRNPVHAGIARSVGLLSPIACDSLSDQAKGFRRVSKFLFPISPSDMLRDAVQEGIDVSYFSPFLLLDTFDENEKRFLCDVVGQIGMRRKTNGSLQYQTVSGLKNIGQIFRIYIIIHMVFSSALPFQSAPL